MTIKTIGDPKNPECNKTHLNVSKANQRGLVHRDYIAHMLRWTHVLKHVKTGNKILDVGCADGMLAQVLYVNRFGNNDYIGVDIRKGELEKADERKLKKDQTFIHMDITNDQIPIDDKWSDVTTCFEVVEHIPEKSLDFVLRELARTTKDDGVVLLSTPNFDGKHKAANHVKEYYEKELQDHLAKFFIIEKKFGTFASQKDIKPVLSKAEKKIWEKLKEYYDSNMFSVIFAPLYPSESRNILWVLKPRNKNKPIIDDFI